MRNFAEQLKDLSNRYPDSAAEIARIEKLGCSSLAELADRIPSLPDGLACGVCFIVQFVGRKRDAKRLAKVLKGDGDRPELWMECAVAIAGVGGISVVNDLEEIAQGEHPPDKRYAATYALSYLTLWRSPDVSRLTDVLLDILENDESPAVRGQACEGLGQYLWDGDRRLAPVKKGIKSLVAALNSESPEVRFWAAYALGQIGSRATLPALRRIVNDRTLLKGWWLVGEEAQDAITTILGGTPPDRERTME